MPKFCNIFWNYALLANKTSHISPSGLFSFDCPSHKTSWLAVVLKEAFGRFVFCGCVFLNRFNDIDAKMQLETFSILVFIGLGPGSKVPFFLRLKVVWIFLFSFFCSMRYLLYARFPIKRVESWHNLRLKHDILVRRWLKTIVN